MDAKIYYQEDCDLSLLEGKTIATIGYGSQGHAHALNLRDSGCRVIIGLYEGRKSWKRAEEQGFEVFTTAEAAKQADIIMILINDEKMVAINADDNEYVAHFYAGCGTAVDLISGKPHDFGGGSHLPPYSAYFWKMEK